MNNLTAISQKTPLDTHHVLYRVLKPQDAWAYKGIRMEALMGTDSRYFTANPIKENAYSLEDWGLICTETYDRAIIGAFRDTVLIGVMSATRSESDMTGLTSYYSAEYIRPAYRHLGIAKNMLLTRDGWAINNDCEKAIFTIRTDNQWLKKQVNHGARIKEELRMSFADGSIAPIYLLERDLLDNALSQKFVA